jgi:hypothetical protein
MRRPPRTGIQRRWFIIGGIVLVGFISISSVVRFYTDLLWFDELGFRSIFLKILSTRVIVGIVGGLFAGIVLLINLEVARRAAPRYRFVTAGTDIAEQYRSAFRPYARLANIAISGLIAIFTGLSTSALWERYLLWVNARPFGVTAPEFGRDVSFYVFGIPFQRAIISSLFGVLVVSLLLSAVAHLFNGSIQPEANRIRVGNVVKVHLSILLGLFALVKAWAYRLDQFELVYSDRGVVTGASYTDVHAQRPALGFLFYLAIVVAVIFFINVFRFRGWLLPGVAIGLWVFASVMAGAVIPQIVQRFQVVPNESEKEAPYIERNIKATRAAFNLDKIDVRNFSPEQSLTPEDVGKNRGTIDNVRVWDPDVLYPIYQRRQAIRSYYEFDDVDVDRYELDGEMRQVMLSARELDTANLEAGAQNWVNTKLQYTHGYGLVANTANSVSTEGLPELLVKDLPPKGTKELLAKENRVYFGERVHPGEYVVVGTKAQEIDYPHGEGDTVVRSSYEGDGGIPLSSMSRRLAFALRFGDTDMLVSDFIDRDSRVLMRRNILERLVTSAPFLKYDKDPYMVVVDGRMKWMVDAYTSTDRYPYSQRIQLGEVIADGMTGRSNYMRNSVKVVVDAYDGTTDFYLVDPSDALASTYQAAFPQLFKPISEMSASLRRHLRYPEDFFEVQATQYRLYHMLKPDQFYAREDAWDIPIDPVASTGQLRVPMDPYYVMMKLPGEDKEEFVLMLPFQPRNRPTLNGWVAARMDPGHYGELIALSFPRERGIDSPENVERIINQRDEISEQFTLWDRAGSRVGHGPIFVIPIEKSLMYVQPIYLTSESSDDALPELRKVIVFLGENQIGFESTLEASLEAALEGRIPEPDGEEPAPSPREPADGSSVADLLDEAAEHFENAQQALREGDLATYQRENEAAARLVERARNEGE